MLVLLFIEMLQPCAALPLLGNLDVLTTTEIQRLLEEHTLSGTLAVKGEYMLLRGSLLTGLRFGFMMLKKI